MRSTRQSIGGLGNLMFKQAFLLGKHLDGEIPDVYVQSQKYWEKHADTIRRYFSDGIEQNDKVAIHIRRGDYLKADHFHVDLSKTDYYQQAIKFFPNDSFIVFCKDNQGQDIEDREWTKTFMDSLAPGRWEFSPMENSETDDMNVMAGCKSIIGANSSFSWWAAFLNTQNGIKVFPKKWFVDGSERTELLPSWILL